jgi:hypothetical protein
MSNIRPISGTKHALQQGMAGIAPPVAPPDRLTWGCAGFAASPPVVAVRAG